MRKEEVPGTGARRECQRDRPGAYPTKGLQAGSEPQQAVAAHLRSAGRHQRFQRQVCYGKTRKQTECDGPTGYTMHILDGIIDKIVRRIFAQVQGVPKSELISARYKEELAARKSLLQEARTEYNKTAKELAALKAEVVKCIQGESSFSHAMLAELIENAEKQCAEKQAICEKTEAEVQDTEAMLKQLRDQYDEIISCSPERVKCAYVTNFCVWDGV